MAAANQAAAERRQKREARQAARDRLKKNAMAGSAKEDA